MPKKKKTLKQKKASDNRHLYSIPEAQVQSTKDSIPTPHSNQSQTTTIKTHEYSFLYADLLKTLTLTISIILIELILKYSFLTL